MVILMKYDERCDTCKYFSKYLMECYYKYDDDKIIVIDCVFDHLDLDQEIIDFLSP